MRQREEEKTRRHPPVTTMERADHVEVAKKGAKRAGAFFAEILPKGICIWSTYDKGVDGSRYGVFVGPGVFHTNENETGTDVALWCTEVRRARSGKIYRKTYPTKQGRRIYPQLMVEKDIAYDFAKAILKLIDRDDVVEQKQVVVQAEQTRGTTADDIEEKMRYLGMIR